MNSIQLGSNELVCVDYSDLLEKILRVLQNPKNQKVFKTSDDGKRLRIDIDAMGG